MCENLAPVEGWLVKGRDFVGFVKGCLHPLPKLFITLRIIHGKKTWSPLPTTKQLPQGLQLVDHECLGGRPALLANPDMVRLVSPVDVAVGVGRECNTPLCQAAIELAEYLQGTGCVGLTGSLAYNATSAHDIDVVVYSREPARVYERLRRLRSENLTEPLRGIGKSWSRRDTVLHRAIMGRRLAMGLFKGFEYNVKIVPCLQPEECRPIRYLGHVTLEGVLTPVSSYTIPAIYTLEVQGQEYHAGDVRCRRLTLYSLRLRYTEIPRAIVRVRGALEIWDGENCVVVPDVGGWVEVTEILEV